MYSIASYEILEGRGIDAQGLQRLHACGLLRPSFRPSGVIAALRAYLWLRERHLDYAAAHIRPARSQRAGGHAGSQLQVRRRNDSSGTRGNYQPEHVFALQQALALYDFYQARVDECDAQIERTLAMLTADKRAPQEPLAKARNRTQQSNALSFDVRTVMYSSPVSTSRRYSESALTSPCGSSPSAAPISVGG